MVGLDDEQFLPGTVAQINPDVIREGVKHLRRLLDENAKLREAAMPFVEEELKYEDGYGGVPCIMCAQEYDHDEDCEWKILKELLNNLTLSTK